MENFFLCFTTLVILAIQSVAGAQSNAKSASQLQFESLQASPGKIVKSYADEALILDGGEFYQIIFVTVQDAKRKQICGYGINFSFNDVTEGDKTYESDVIYICQAGKRFQPYEGDIFVNIVRNCGNDFCPSPAAGVGNMLVAASAPLNLSRLSRKLKFDIHASL